MPNAEPVVGCSTELDPTTLRSWTQLKSRVRHSGAPVFTFLSCVIICLMSIFLYQTPNSTKIELRSKTKNCVIRGPSSFMGPSSDPLGQSWILENNTSYWLKWQMSARYLDIGQRQQGVEFSAVATEEREREKESKQTLKHQRPSVSHNVPLYFAYH